MALQNYQVNPKRPTFSSYNEDDDDDISAFMKSSSATYLAADRLPVHSREEQTSSQEQHKDILQQMRKVEQRTIESTKRSLGAIIESEKIGIETAQELSKQHEQLTNAESKLDDINYTLKDTQKSINGIKSIFSSVKQWWGTPKNPPTDKSNDAKSASQLFQSNQPEGPKLTKHLESAVGDSQTSLQFNQSAHPAYRLRGLDEEDDPDMADFRAQTKRVNEQIDNDLDMMSAGLSRLRNLAQGLGSEIEDQNTMLDRLTGKADKADITLNSQNVQMNRMLKR